jgi:fatty acid desaturase
MLFIHFLLLGFLFYLNWFNTVFLFALPMVNGLWLAMWATYDHHSGLESEEPTHACRNIIDPLYNKMTGNLGYHTAHHLNQGLHWSKLPELHSEIEGQIPSQCYIPVRLPYSWFRKDKQI